MDTPIKRLFNRRKSTSRINGPPDGFQQTAAYGSITPGAAPQIGAYPIKPSEKPKLFGHNKTSSNAQSLDDAGNGTTKRRSRAKSTSGVSTNGVETAGDVSRGTSIGPRDAGASPLPKAVPPVPKIPQSISQTKSLGRNSFNYVDILQAVGAHDDPNSRPTSSDPYSMTVADRNARNSRLPDGVDTNSFRSDSIKSSAVDRQGTADYHSFLSHSHKESFERIREVKGESMDSQSTSFTTPNKKKRNVHSSAQWFESHPQSSHTSEHKHHSVSSQNHARSDNVSLEDNQGTDIPRNRAERLGRLHARASILNTERSLGLNASEPPKRPIEKPRSTGAHPPSAYQATAQRFANDGTTEAIEALRNRHRPQMSVTSDGSIPSPLMSGLRHRPGLSGDLGSDTSDYSELENEVGRPISAKLDPIQAIRESIVGVNRYTYSSDEPDLSRPPSRRSKAGAGSRDGSTKGVNRREAEPVQESRTSKSRAEMGSPSRARTISPRKPPEHTPEFDLRAEFHRLELENEAAKTNAIYSPLDQNGWQQRTQSPSSIRSTQDNNGRASVPQPFIARDFAQQPLDQSEINEDESNSEDDALPPSFSRERAMAMDRSITSSNRRSLISNYLRKASQSRERNKSTSKSNKRTSSMTRPTSSHTLKATIDRPDDIVDPTNGYSRTNSLTSNGISKPNDPIEAIQEKRKRSLTLEAMARAPLNLEPLPSTALTSSQPSTSKLPLSNDGLSSLNSPSVQADHPIPVPRPLNPTIKSPPLPASKSPPPAFSATGARLNNIKSPHSTQPLRQYQHHNNQPSGTSWTTNSVEAENDDADENFVSARSSIHSTSTSTPSTPPISPTIANPALIPSQQSSPISTKSRPGTRSGRARFSYLFNSNGTPDTEDPDPLMLDRYYDVDRDNINNRRPDTSSSTYSTESKRIDVPPRRSSLYKHSSHRSKSGNYFGDSVTDSQPGSTTTSPNKADGHGHTRGNSIASIHEESPSKSYSKSDSNGNRGRAINANPGGEMDEGEEADTEGEGDRTPTASPVRSGLRY